MAVAFGTAALVVYVRSLYPDVAGGDSGELVSAVATGGVIHPPGYPLYALLGRLFTLLPLGTVAWRLNLFSAACDAAAASVLLLAVARFTDSRWAGATAAALFAFAPGIWRYAICAEVFALNNLACAVLLLLAVLYDATGRRRYALGGAWAFGLGLANHHTIALAALPIVAWAGWRSRGALLRPRTAIRLALAFAAGLLPYLYLVVAARHPPAVSWGSTSTWDGFWTHVLRREYGSFQLAVSGIARGADRFGPGSILAAWAVDLFDQLNWWGVPLAVIGVVGCVRAGRRRPLSLVLLVAPLLSVAVFALLGNLPVSGIFRGIVARFWQEPDLFVFALCGVGLAELERRAPRWVPIGVCAAVVASSLVVRFAATSRRGNRIVRSYGAEILRAAPRGALLLTRGDLITNTVRYLQSVEGERGDVRVVDLELLGLTWYGPRHPEIALPGPRYMPGASDGFTMAQLLDANVGSSPVLLCGGPKADDHSADARYGRWPFGLCEAVHSGSEPVNVERYLAESEAALPRVDFADEARPEGSWEDVVWKDCWEARQARAAHLLEIAGADPARRRYIAVAVTLFEGIVRDNPDVPGHVYRNLAVALGRQGLDTAERRAEARAAWRKYLETAPKGDPYTKAVEEEVERLSGP
jgi:hypothetical protein